MPSFAAIYICWGLFVGIWAIGAVYNARNAPKTVSRDLWPGQRLWWAWIVVIVGVLLRAFVPGSVWAALSLRNAVLEDVGMVILGGATLFTLWARWTLGKMWSGVPSLRENHELHTDGPYRITRHPIYTGILGMLLGTALIVGLPGVAILLVFGSVFLVRIPREEELMLQRFGEQYVRYQGRVPRLVPFVRI